MNIKEFNNLSDEAKEYTLNKVLEIIEIVERNPSTIEDLLTFAEWQAKIGKFGEDMKLLLYGMYPFYLGINRREYYKKVK